jgi:hypothetical protein
MFFKFIELYSIIGRGATLHVSWPVVCKAADLASLLVQNRTVDAEKIRSSALMQRYEAHTQAAQPQATAHLSLSPFPWSSRRAGYPSTGLLILCTDTPLQAFVQIPLYRHPSRVAPLWIPLYRYPPLYIYPCTDTPLRIPLYNIPLRTPLYGYARVRGSHIITALNLQVHSAAGTPSYHALVLASCTNTCEASAGLSGGNSRGQHRPSTDSARTAAQPA